MILKHRVWTGERMIYDEPEEGVSFFVCGAGVFETILSHPTHAIGPLYTLRPRDWKAMMATGLKDEGGTEIYEGDIYEVDDEGDDSRFAVEFSEGAFRARWADGRLSTLELRESMSGVSWIHTGNIYETPDLAPPSSEITQDEA